MKKFIIQLFSVITPLILFAAMCAFIITIGLHGNLPLSSSYKYQDSVIFSKAGEKL
jgi:hypothetical protein